MSVKTFLLTMMLTTLVCWSAVGLIVWNIDPSVATAVGLLLFYLALFFAVWGTLSVVGIGVRMVARRREPLFTYVGISLRQALWFAILINLALFLLSQNLFDWWMSIPLIIGFASIEGFSIARTTTPHSASRRVVRRTQQSEVDQMTSLES